MVRLRVKAVKRGLLSGVPIFLGTLILMYALIWFWEAHRVDQSRKFCNQSVIAGCKG